MSNIPPQRPNNIGSKLLKDVENENLFQALGKGCVTLATAVVQLFTSDPPERTSWTLRCSGVACFVKDNPMRSYFIRIYNIQTGQMLFEQELYTTFKYKDQRVYFHTFEADEFQAALNFVEDYQDEAIKFKYAIDAKLKERQQKRIQKKSLQQSQKVNSHQLPTRPPPPASATPPPSTTSTRNKDTNMIKTSLTIQPYSKYKFKDKDSEKRRRLTKKDIGSPTCFTHVSHLGYDPTTEAQMNVHDLDPDMKVLFKELGYGEQQSVPNDVFEFVDDFVSQWGGIDEFKKQIDTKPSAPPSPSKGQPPKLPSTRPVGATPYPQPPSPSSDYVIIDLKNPPSPPPIPTTAPATSTVSASTAQNKRSTPKVKTLNKKPFKSTPPPSPPCSSVDPPPPPPPPPPLPPPSDTLPPPPVAPPPPPMSPPPPPTVTHEAQSMILSNHYPTTTTGRGDLLEQIRSGGRPLRKVDANDSKPTGDTRGDLLSAIRSGTSLKHVKRNKQEESSVPTMTKDESVLGALARALAERQKHIQVSDDECTDDDEDDLDDDDDWDD